MPRRRGKDSGKSKRAGGTPSKSGEPKAAKKPRAPKPEAPAAEPAAEKKS